jgi:hypothetical protein
MNAEGPNMATDEAPKAEISKKRERRIENVQWERGNIVPLKLKRLNLRFK